MRYKTKTGVFCGVIALVSVLLSDQNSLFFAGRPDQFHQHAALLGSDYHSVHVPERHCRCRNGASGAELHQQHEEKRPC